MKILQSFFLSVFYIFSFSCEANNIEKNQEIEQSSADTSWFVVNLLPHSGIVFNYYDNIVRTLDLVNNSSKDSTILIPLTINKPTVLYYASSILAKNGTKEYNVSSVLLMPADSLVFTKYGKIEYSKGLNDYIDKIIFIPKSLYPLYFLHFSYEKEIGDKSIDTFISEVQNLYDRNQGIIDTLPVTVELKNYLTTFNRVLKYQQLSLMPLKNVSENNKFFTDSTVADMLENIDKIVQLQTPFSSQIYDFIINYYSRKRPNRIGLGTDLWQDYDKVPAQIKSKPFYSEHLYARLANTFSHNFRLLPQITQILKAKKNNLALTDSLYQLAQILGNSKSDYIKAKEKILIFQNGKFVFLLENKISTDLGIKNIKEVELVYLSTVQGKKVTLKNAIYNDPHKLSVIDFWASWCIPCIEEMPFMKKIEVQLKNKSVKFIAISLDKKEDKNKWISILKQQGLYTNSNQYILADINISPLIKRFDITAVPRYILIGKDGKIISADAPRPSDPALKKLIEENI